MEHLLNDADFQQALFQMATDQGQPYEQVRNEAKTYLEELATEHEQTWVVAGLEAVEYILSRGYDKNIDVNFTELRELTKLMRRHPIAFVMTHKTYIDMFVLAVVLAHHGLPVPYIFAGINMAFMGVGQLGRKTGAIFIRRNIKEKPVYRLALRHFISYKLRQKSSFMWALEGTRSRTGKLVWPKMGILKYIREAEEASNETVKYVPVSIVYDLIPDVEQMTKEGRGTLKKAEDLAWFLQYVRNMGGNFGRIAIRFGEPVDAADLPTPDSTVDEVDKVKHKSQISRFAFDLVNRINDITPITTSSLICTSLLSKFSNTKRGIEGDTLSLMQLVESHKPDVLVDRGRPIGESVQEGLNIMMKAGLFLQQGEGLNAKHVISTEKYLPTTYYANMAAHHFYQRAFIELALLKVADLPAAERQLAFWQEIMALRDTFKFEFFYSRKEKFVEEIESDLRFMAPNWTEAYFTADGNIHDLLAEQQILVAPVMLFNYVEAYRVVAQGLQAWDVREKLEDKAFVNYCLALGEALRWQGRIRRIEAVSIPFLTNGIRLVRNRKLIPTKDDPKLAAIQIFIDELANISRRISDLQGITVAKPFGEVAAIPVERAIVPGSKTEGITSKIMETEEGPHIAAFFDLDRTLIRGFSAKEFFQTRRLSGRMSAREIVAQFAGALVYAGGNKNFAGMAALGAKGVNGVSEHVFHEVGEEVYYNHLAEDIYPESRALVAAHMAKGHTVVIVSAATPYQVNPIARDLGIAHVMCTRMEVIDGKFTGNIVEPACWGEGKAIAGRNIAEELNLDLTKSYFYTDSAEDMPLLEIVGHPRPCNPDQRLSSIAFQNDWPVYRFNNDQPSSVSNVVRTALTGGSMIPAVLSGIGAGLKNMSWREGINSTMAAVGDFGTTMAGIRLAVKHEERLDAARPAVFIFNHQSSADLLIAAKLIRRDALGIAKKELQNMPIIGQLLMASGAIFLDRKNKDKAIEAMKPAVDALQGGTSIIIFPEGTRSYDYTLGEFKKGAFHLAMQAGVPVVPVVIKNAHDAMPRGTTLLRPAVVEVVVLPPVATKKWKAKDLNKNIAAIRQQFLEELGQVEVKS
ncbi:MAG: HAD-IB family hydrolase [Bacteroidota bacterium]